MRRPKPICHTLIVVLLVCISIASAQAVDKHGSPITKPDLIFRLALQPNEANKVWDAAYLVKQELEKRSNGRIKVLFYPAAVLGNERQILETCYMGIVEMVQVTSSVITTLDSTFDVLGMPYLFVDEEHHQKVLNGKLGQELLDSLITQRLQGLSFYSCGFRSIYAS